MRISHIGLFFVVQHRGI